MTEDDDGLMDEEEFLKYAVMRARLQFPDTYFKNPRVECVGGKDMVSMEAYVEEEWHTISTLVTSFAKVIDVH